MNAVIDIDIPRPIDRDTDSDNGLPAFLKARSSLFGIAFRMLGCAAAAEDVVQDVWIRWQTTDRRLVRDAGAFLATTATRVAINVLQSARVRRAVDTGSAPPEPVDTAADPRQRAERRQALLSGLQLLAERLTPTERAAYILREAFDYSYREIARLLRLEVANARQVVTRARQHVADSERLPAPSRNHEQLLEALIAALDGGDLSGLEACCASEALASAGDRTQWNGRAARWRARTASVPGCDAPFDCTTPSAAA